MIYAFGDFELDEGRFELRRGGEPVEVQGKVLEILLCLVRERDRLVTKDELIRKGWGEIAVSEASLSHAVMLARRCLGDDGVGQRYIQTVRGRGYRFIGT